MTIKKETISLRLMLLVAMPDMDPSISRLFKQEGISSYYRLSAEGTAGSRILQTLGLDSSERTLYCAYLTGKKANSLMRKVRLRLHNGNGANGIACTVPLDGISQSMLKIIQQMYPSSSTHIETASRQKEKEAMKAEHSLIISITSRGYISDVIRTARQAGAYGGTFLHSFRVSDENMNALFGLSPEEEKEILMMIVTADRKNDILLAISKAYGMATPAKGIVFSMPVDQTSGYEEYEEAEVTEN